MKQSRTRLLFALLLLCCLFARCAAAESAYPLTLTDQAGRTVVIEEAPQRIVSGYYISTSLLIALDEADKLVGIEAKAGKRPIYRLSAPQLIDLPSVGTAKEFDLEGCAALEPDLVILPLKLRNSAEILEQLGISVLLVNPESEALLDEAASLIAAALDCSERKRQLSDHTAALQAMLDAALEGVHTPSVYLAGNSSLLSTAGSAMYQHGMIERAGAKNAAAGLDGSYWAEISYEQLLAYDPDCILLASDAVYTCEDILADPNLAACKAVAQGRVYKLPDTAEAWDSPVPSGVLGSVWLAGVLHPDRISRETVSDAIGTYYETFYDFTYPQD